jgi:hypothetical protein
MNTDNTQDGAEPSLASAGSQPVAWAVLRIDGSVYDVYRNEEEAKAIDEVVTGNHGVAPLCRSPTLTDVQRAAIEYGALVCDATAGMANDRATIDGASRAADVLRGLLERPG